MTVEVLQQVKLAVELRRPLRQKLNVALPNMWLTREGLMQDPQVALLACSLVAKEVLNHIRPAVSFSKEVQGGDNTPYNINVPVRKLTEGDEGRPLTLLEERLLKENKASREEFLTCLDKVPILNQSFQYRHDAQGKIFSNSNNYWSILAPFLFIKFFFIKF